MLIDALYFDDLVQTLFKKRPALQVFVRFLERRLGGKFVFDGTHIPVGREDLVDLFELAEKLRAATVIRSYGSVSEYPDEPRFHQWRAELAQRNTVAGGMSSESARAALTATLAEAIERHLWFTVEFRDFIHASVRDIGKQGCVMLPEEFAGFTPEQRSHNPRLVLRPDAEYRWVRGLSLVSGKPVWVPAQVASGKYGIQNLSAGTEPVISIPITTGMAAGPSQTFARLGGALEIVERDAFMITWLNKLSPPRIDLAALAERSPSLATLLRTCARYRLTIDAMLLPTDAPTHAVCVVIRDAHEKMPPWSMGLCAHRSLPHAVEHATHEALRMRRNIRTHRKNWPISEEKKVRDIVHVERAQYWAIGERSLKLAFLTAGPLIQPPEKDSAASPEEHLALITQWCKGSEYECAAISYTGFPENVSPWHVEMIVMPELLPIHQNEKYQYGGGPRRERVARMFGYTPRLEPFLDEPHPFC